MIQRRLSKAGLAWLALAVLALAFPMKGAAAEAEAESVKAREVVITATKTEKELLEAPASISVVDEEELRRQSPASVADALDDIPGVEILDQSIAGAKRVLIRGETGARVLVLIDGQKISEQKSMDGAALLIDPNRVERIEVVKGPASVLYGSEAIGGVVNIITKKGGERPIQAEAVTTLDSSTDGMSQYLSAFGSHEGLSYRVSGTFSDQDNRHTPAGTLDGSNYMTRDLAAFVGYDTENISVGASYDDYYSNINSVTPDGVIGDTLSYFQIDLPKWERRKGAAFFELRDISDTLLKVRADAYYQKTRKVMHNDMDLNIAMGPTMSMTMEMRQKTDNDQDTYGGSVQSDWLFFDSHYVILGYDVARDDLDATTDIATTTIMPPMMGVPPSTELSSYSYEGSMTTHAIYLQDEWTFLDDFTLTAGVRQTWAESSLDDTDNPEIETKSKTHSYPVFSAGLTWAALDDLVFRGLFSQGYRLPTLQQLYIGTVHGGSTPTLPNDDLDPETSNNFELGARYDDGVFSVDLAGFVTMAEDYITTEAVDDSADQFVNVDKANTHGVELSLGYLFASLDTTLYGSGTWLKREFKSDGFSTWDTGHPEFMGRLGARWERFFDEPGVNVFADLYARFASEAKDESSDGSVEEYDAWQTLNLTLGAEFGAERQYFVTLALNNLLDEEYTLATSTLVEPGMHAVLRLGLSF